MISPEMKTITKEVGDLVKEYGLTAIISTLIEDFDGKADFANLSGEKLDENNYRKIAVILFEALRKIDNTK